MTAGSITRDTVGQCSRATSNTSVGLVLTDACRASRSPHLAGIVTVALEMLGFGGIGQATLALDCKNRRIHIGEPSRPLALERDR